MIYNLPKNGIGGLITEGSFSYTGQYLFSRTGTDWELALLTSGTLSWANLPGLVDVFCVGSGKTGQDGFFSGEGTGDYDYNDSFINSGKGGDSGKTSTYNSAALTASCAAVIGTSGAESTLTCGETVYSSAPGSARTGGRGATLRQATSSSGTVNKGGVDGVFAYGLAEDTTMIEELSGILFAPSGGGGHANNNYRSPYDDLHPTPSRWYVYTDQHGGDNSGGDTNGGVGGTREHHDGFAATGFGAGGGGGYGDGSGHENGSGGLGGPGIILIRNHRS